MDVMCYYVYRSMIHLIVDYGQLKYLVIPTKSLIKTVIMKLTFDKDQTELHIFYWFNWQPLKTNQQKPLCVRCTSDPNVFYWESSTMYHGPLHSYFETTHKLVRNTLFRWNKLENSKWLNMSWWKTNGTQNRSHLPRILNLRSDFSLLWPLFKSLGHESYRKASQRNPNDGGRRFTKSQIRNLQ